MVKGAEMSEKITLVLDKPTGRPMCVLLQAAFGCQSSIVSSAFDAETWFVSPQPEMIKVTDTVENWRKHAAEINKKYGRKPR
jgi:hypothetical protein